ncbi:MAG: gamma-glutamyl-gamma-aminobutyrate hydrolase family protein [Candidatus Binatia bacterium]|nr:gamma-glutamyl-gamma-aminobutyrate hydrolase family protein [Candidatus Binatia bacterium]
MPAPVVGITSYARDDSELPCFSLPVGYVDRVVAAGGDPVILPPAMAQPVRLLDRVDGLVFSGGGDVSPEAYGGDHHETIYSVSEERDRFEFELLRAALQRQDIPILCICRGLQVLNVVLGGSLHEHLPEVFGEAVAHRIPPRQTCRHHVRVDPQSRLAQILGCVEIDVLSWHHQGIDRLALDLRPVGWAEDGLIEAVEHRGHPWCFGVQWHPEMEPSGSKHDRLFAAFIDAASVHARRRNEW